MNAQIKNLTPHAVNILASIGVITIQPEKTPARLIATTVDHGYIPHPDGRIPITRSEYGQATGLPDFQSGVYYIVSQLVKQAYPKRIDLLVPAELVRDEGGRIIGCRSLGI